MMNESVGEKYMAGGTLESGELNLLEMMEVCSNIYLTHTLAVQILETREDFLETDAAYWMSEILLLEFPLFAKRLRQIH